MTDPTPKKAPADAQPHVLETWTFGARPSRRDGVSSTKTPSARAGDTQRHARIDAGATTSVKIAGQVEPRSGSTAISARPTPPLFTARVSQQVPANVAPVERSAPPSVVAPDTHVSASSAPSAPRSAVSIAPQSTSRASALATPPNPQTSEPRPTRLVAHSVAARAPAESQPAPAARVPPQLPAGAATTPRWTRRDPPTGGDDWAAYPDPLVTRANNDPLDLSFAAPARAPRSGPPTHSEPEDGQSPPTRPARPRTQPVVVAAEARQKALAATPATEPELPRRRLRPEGVVEVRATQVIDRPELEFHNRPTLLREPRVPPVSRRHIEHLPGQEDETVFVEAKQRSSAAFSDTAWFKRPVPPGAVDPDTGFVSFDADSYVPDPTVTNTQRRRYSLRKANAD